MLKLSMLQFLKLFLLLVLLLTMFVLALVLWMCLILQLLCFKKRAWKKWCLLSMLPNQENVFAMDSEFAMDFDDNFWKIIFDKKLLKHKDRLNVIFVQPPLFLLNSCFNNLHNYLISITYIVDPKLIPKLLGVVDRTWLSFNIFIMQLRNLLWRILWSQVAFRGGCGLDDRIRMWSSQGCLSKNVGAFIFELLCLDCWDYYSLDVFIFFWLLYEWFCGQHSIVLVFFVFELSFD